MIQDMKELKSTFNFGRIQVSTSDYIQYLFYFVEYAVFNFFSKCWGTTWYGRHALGPLGPNYYKLELSEEGCDIILAWNNIQCLTLADLSHAQCTDLSHAQCTGMSLSINTYNYTFKFLEFEPILLEFLPIFHGFVLLGDLKLSNSLLEMTLFKKKYHNHVFGTSFHKYCNS